MTSNGNGREYIWITRWEDFQHYAPERDRPPAWIKAYTKQLDDDDYRDLTPVQRALLHDLRMVFAKAHGKLAADSRETRENTARTPRETHENTARGTREVRERFTSGTRALTHRVGYRVTSAQLKALNHAGFIEFISRETLDQRLEKLYTTRARARAHQEEVEVEKEKSSSPKRRKPRTPADRIRAQIRNGAITDLVTLDAYIQAAGINGDTELELLALLPTEPTS